jgi:hypothetical protein
MVLVVGMMRLEENFKVLGGVMVVVVVVIMNVIKIIVTVIAVVEIKMWTVLVFFLRGGMGLGGAELLVGVRC